MRIFAEFSQDGGKHWACGTDAVCILDGRNTLDNQIDCALRHAEEMKDIHNYTHFCIYGSYDNNFDEDYKLVGWTKINY